AKSALMPVFLPCTGSSALRRDRLPGSGKPMSLPQTVRRSLEARKDGSVQPASKSSKYSSGHVSDADKASRHRKKLMLFLEVVQQRSEDFELYISTLRMELQLHLKSEPEIPLAQPAIFLGNSAKPCGHHVVVSL
ncbi:unnamed protein product, partial [Effrenium voratum]